MKRNAFSLIELIFVIVLIGVISGIGFYMSRPDYTRQDAQYTLLKLKEARYRAIGFQTSNGSCSDAGWIEFKTDDIIANNSSDNLSEHKIKSNISLTKTICFDSLGRPHDGNRSDFTAPLLPNDLIITFSSNNTQETNITLYSGTGYAIIPCNN
jgi:prepilin-type N-terminal cleavage/methylation domain-containing protein